MVFTAVEQRRVQYEKLTENDTVVAIAHDFPAVFDNILRVLPLTKTIAIVNGTSPNEKFWQEVLRRELAPLTGRVELRWYDGKSFEEILSNAAKLPPHSAIFWHLMNIQPELRTKPIARWTNFTPSLACRFSHTTGHFSMEGPSVVPCTQCSNQRRTRLRLLFASSTAKKPVTSKRRQARSQLPYSTGDNCNDGELPKAVC